MGFPVRRTADGGYAPCVGSCWSTRYVPRMASSWADFLATLWMRKTIGWPTDYKIEWNKLQNNGISTYLQNMEAHSEDVKHVESGLSGLKNFQEYILETDKSIKPYLISPMFNLFYSCIETNGTGGAAFRNFFKTYLEECIEQTNDKRLKNGLALAEESIKEWRLLALKFLDASKKIKKIKSNEERKTLYENISLQAKKVYEAEEKMYNYFKEKNFKRIN